MLSPSGCQLVIKAVTVKVKKCGVSCYMITLTVKDIHTGRDVALNRFKHVILLDCSKFTIKSMSVHHCLAICPHIALKLLWVIPMPIFQALHHVLRGFLKYLILFKVSVKGYSFQQNLAHGIQFSFIALILKKRLVQSLLSSGIEQ